MSKTFNAQDLPIKVYPDGDQWCALLGEDLLCCPTGFGANPIEAIAELWRSLPDEDEPETEGLEG